MKISNYFCKNCLSHIFNKLLNNIKCICALNFSIFINTLYNLKRFLRLKSQHIPLTGLE